MFGNRISARFFRFAGVLLAAILFLNDSAYVTGDALAASNRDLGPATAFTYQGELELDGARGGSRAGSTISHENLMVDDGRFTVLGDFGDVFDGSNRYLEIAVRAGDSSGAYRTLSPRQRWTAAPNASHAGSVPWAGVQDVPDGFAEEVDGVDDAVDWAGASSLAGNGSEQVHWGNLMSLPPRFGVAYANVIVVAKSGGDYIYISDAVKNITDAAADNPYLVWVAPGVYEEQVRLKPYVTLQGAGEGATIVRWTGGNQSPSEGTSSVTLVGDNNATVRHLTVESDATGTGNYYAISIYNSYASPTIHFVTATATGGRVTNYGVFNENDSSPTMTHVTAAASTGATSYGVVNDNGSSPTMTHVTATASGATDNYGVYNHIRSSPVMSNVTARAEDGRNNYGVYNDINCSSVMTNVTASASGGSYNIGVANVSSSPSMTNVTATASGGTFRNYGVYNQLALATMINVTATGSGGSHFNRGVYNYDDSWPTMTNVTATATGSGENSGVYNFGAGATMINVTASASEGTFNYGVYNQISSSSIIRDSKLKGRPYTIYTDSSSTAQAANSLLIGPVSPGVTCYNNYDAAFNPHPCNP